jgi:DNA-directed RNA polymerase specialized sigma24 family protein
MRRDDFVDFFIVDDGHLAIHARLEEWARWVRVRPHGWQVSPMFRQYRSHAWQWERPEVRQEVNIPQAVEMEKAVSHLPEKHRAAIRWCYVFTGHPSRMARELGVSKQGLSDLIAAGRTMLMNRGMA